MLKQIIISIAMLCSIDTSYACGPFYSRIFHCPRYIDPEYPSRFCSEGENEYGKDFQFQLILSSYLKKPQSEPSVKDSELRKLSKETQPLPYAEYEKGACFFNEFKYEEALKIFTELHRSSFDWVREASTYMIARTQKILAETNWDGVWDGVMLTEDNALSRESNRKDMIDQEKLREAKRSYDVYLKEYPNGLYADSARNMQRHFLLLLGKQDEYDRSIKQAIADAALNVYENLFNEFNNHYKGKLNIEKDTAPILIAYYLIHYEVANRSDLAILDARKADFNHYPGLHAYLRTLLLFRLKEYQTLLTEVSTKPLDNTPLSISLAYLRYRAQFYLNKNREALDTLLKMYALTPNDSSLEKHIALLQMKANQSLWLFSKECPIHDKTKLAIFAQYGLTDGDILRGLNRQDIPEVNRHILAEELAQRYLLSQDYMRLSTLLKRYPDVNRYQDIKSDIDVLSLNPNNPTGLLQIGKFIQDHYVFAGAMDVDDPYFGPEYRMNELFDEDKTLKEVFSKRVTHYLPPLWYYKKSLQLTTGSPKSNFDEARALSYLSQCPHYFEIRHRCTSGEKIDYNPKHYFNLLHTKYKNSEWARKTPYWYKA